MSQLIQNNFGFRFIRSERTNQVTHKYHHWLPKFEQLAEFLPEAALIRPKSDEHRALIGSLRSQEIETPEQSLLRLLKNYFYQAILRGENPKEISLGRDQLYGSGKPPQEWLDHTQLWVGRFLKYWRNPGFKFRNQFEFFVNSNEVSRIDYLSLGWIFNPTWRSDKETLKELWDSYIRNSMDLINDDEALRLISQGEHPTIPDRIRNRLNLFMESDNLILWEFSQKTQIPDDIILVSTDRKLAGQILRLGRGKNPNVVVWVVLPIVYLLGRTEEFSGFHGRGVRKRDIDHGTALIIEDPGAMMHTDFVYFEEGMVDDIYFMNEVKCLPTKLYPGVFTVFIEGDSKPVDPTRWADYFLREWAEF
jgi:hypothetical protein